MIYLSPLFRLHFSYKGESHACIKRVHPVNDLVSVVVPNEKRVKLSLPICRLAGKTTCADDSESFFNMVWQYYELLDLPFFEAYNLNIQE
jgi:hypothetical protein